MPHVKIGHVGADSENRVSPARIHYYRQGAPTSFLVATQTASYTFVLNSDSHHRLPCSYSCSPTALLSVLALFRSHSSSLSAQNDAAASVSSRHWARSASPCVKKGLETTGRQRPHRDRQTPLHTLLLPDHRSKSIVMSSGQELPEDHAPASTTGLAPATQPQPVVNAIDSAFTHESQAAPTAQDTTGEPLNHGTTSDNNLHSSSADVGLTSQPSETQSSSLQAPTGDEAGPDDDQSMENTTALYPNGQTADEQNLEVDVCFT